MIISNCNKLADASHRALWEIPRPVEGCWSWDSWGWWCEGEGSWLRI